MAVTKIWTVSDSITRILGYVSNPDKTEYEDLRDTLHYAGDTSILYLSCQARTAGRWFRQLMQS